MSWTDREVEYVAGVKTVKTANLALLARDLGMLNDKLKATDELDLTKLSNETIAMMRSDLGLADND
jgi:hypothetical protein